MSTMPALPTAPFPGLPRLGDPAPPFEARTTHGDLSLTDFRGVWLILFSHPADFTPVCTTEFIAFAEVQPRLRAMSCELLGLSCDSLWSHIAWVRNIEEKMGVRIPFPVIADSDRRVATRYGMIMPGDGRTETSRAVFVIDEKQIVRAMIHYPRTTGRNVDEIVRLVEALQTSDAHGVATPANWHRGDRAIVPPPATQAEAAERIDDERFECTDWYFCTRSI